MAEQSRHTDVWDNCLRIIEQIIEPQKFQIWFKPIKPLSFENQTLTIEVKSDFFRQYLEEVYLDLLKKTLKRVIGAGARLVYRVPVVKNEKPMTYPRSTPIPPKAIPDLSSSPE